MGLWQGMRASLPWEHAIDRDLDSRIYLSRAFPSSPPGYLSLSSHPTRAARGLASSCSRRLAPSAIQALSLVSP
jgi:hypothetical protein